LKENAFLPALARHADQNPISNTKVTRWVQPGAIADHPTAWIKPQLATLVKTAPDGPDWLHEIKLDGYRMHARLDSGRVQILTRRGTIGPTNTPLSPRRLPNCRRRTPT
jgi:ATP-dependent DNA ligase